MWPVVTDNNLRDTMFGKNDLKPSITLPDVVDLSLIISKYREK